MIVELDDVLLMLSCLLQVDERYQGIIEAKSDTHSTTFPPFCPFLDKT
jgi:hypothetical protein